MVVMKIIKMRRLARGSDTFYLLVCLKLLCAPVHQSPKLQVSQRQAPVTVFLIPTVQCNCLGVARVHHFCDPVHTICIQSIQWIVNILFFRYSICICTN